MLVYSNVTPLCASTLVLGAEQDLQSHAAENNGAHRLRFKRVRDRGAATCQRRSQ